MKKIIYSRPDGGLSVVHPSKGGRLAYWITLADGTVLPQGANTEAFSDVPAMPVDHILRSWPIAGAVAEWAETEDEFVARIRAKDVPADATDVQIVEEGAIPQDRTYRNAWKAKPGGIEHDMEKARAIHRGLLRPMRAKLMMEADATFFKALEAWLLTQQNVPDQLLAVIRHKQALRDVTAHPAIDSATSVEELSTAIPGVLK